MVMAVKQFQSHQPTKWHQLRETLNDSSFCYEILNFKKQPESESMEFGVCSSSSRIEI
jgi:hypothetical protein